MSITSSQHPFYAKTTSVHCASASMSYCWSNGGHSSPLVFLEPEFSSFYLDGRRQASRTAPVLSISGSHGPPVPANARTHPEIATVAGDLWSTSTTQSTIPHRCDLLGCGHMDWVRDRGGQRWACGCTNGDEDEDECPNINFDQFRGNWRRLGGTEVSI